MDVQTVTITQNDSNDVAGQATQHVLMIEPVAFQFNQETASNNYFQRKTSGAQPKALAEFKKLVKTLKMHGVNVIVVKDTLLPHTPDSIFPNNTLSFHENARAYLYPMYALSRRLEADQALLYKIKAKGFVLKEIFDMRPVADSKTYLEGLGSMVLDRKNRIAYACRSERTSGEWFKKTCQRLKYKPILFTAKQNVGWRRLPICHTNMMMSIADDFVVACLDAIDDEKEKQLLLDAFERTNKEVILISEKQMGRFAGNMVLLRTNATAYETALVMSDSAYKALNAGQIDKIERHCPIIHVDISTIEENGGGSVGCMMAEIFLPKRKTHTGKVSVSLRGKAN